MAEAADGLSVSTRVEMLGEAVRIIDAGAERGVTLRLFGGLAVRVHCTKLEFCERDHADLDMVGLTSRRRQISALMKELGYHDNAVVTLATQGRQLQFSRRCIHGDAEAHVLVHPDDHVDVFLDAFAMDHEIDLKDRLGLERYTIPVSDILLTKLQIFRLDGKDLRDIVTLLADLEVGERDDPDTIDGRYIARLCAADWGLFYDVTTNLQRVGERLAAFDLTDAQQDRARRGLARLIAAIDDSPKNLRWRLRARVGTRASWRNELEEQE